MNRLVKLVIADDHLLFIDGLKLLLETEPGIEVTGVANDGRELLTLLRITTPDIVLLDINMPELNGLETAKYLKLSYPALKVVILSTYNEKHLIEKARELGVSGYLLKNSSKTELTETIRSVLAGASCFPALNNKAADSFKNDDPFLKQFNLTKRELEILQYIKQGFTNQQISDALFISVYTVETHRKNIMQKLNVNSTPALMKFIYQQRV